MSRTHKHMGKWYFNNNLRHRKEVRKYLLHARRRNREKGYFKQIKIALKEKELNKDMINMLHNIQ